MVGKAGGYKSLIEWRDEREMRFSVFSFFFLVLSFAAVTSIPDVCSTIRICREFVSVPISVAFVSVLYVRCVW